MRRGRADRWIAAGAALAGIGATLASGYWIYTLESSSTGGFWRFPGFACMGILGWGLVMLVTGFFLPDRDCDAIQRQRGGDGATNLQAGRDISIDVDRGE